MRTCIAEFTMAGKNAANKIIVITEFLSFLQNLKLLVSDSKRIN